MGRHLPGKDQTDAPQTNRDCLCRAHLVKEACGLLGGLANAERLMIVALLNELGELHVNEMVDKLGANRASLSRQLGHLRDQSVVTTRRKHNRIYYTLDHTRTAALIKTLNTVMGVAPD